MSGLCQGCGVELPPKTWKGREQKWCSERCRKDQYDLACVDCGARVDGTTPGKMPNPGEPRCLRCAAVKSGREKKVWTRERCIEAGQWWEREYGEPPAIRDWFSGTAEYVCNDHERAERYVQLHGEGQLPNARTVMREFGAWAAFMQALGHQPRAPHGGAGNQHRRRSARAAA